MYAVVLFGLILGAVSYEYQTGPPGILAPVLGTAAMTLVPSAAAAAVTAYLAARTRKGASHQDESRWSPCWVYARASTFISGLSLAAYAVSLHGFGWVTLPGKAGVERWGLLTGGIIAAPFLASLVLSWIPLHYAHAHVRSAGPTLAQQLSFNVRQYVLTVVVPMAVVLGVLDAIELVPAPVKARFGNPAARAAVKGVGILLGYTLAPVALVRLWKTHPMRECEMRNRLTQLCRRLGVTFRDIRVWETPGLYFLNAAVMGLAGRVRYILVSRTLLEAMTSEQIEAVFAHELGHARRHHIAYYLLFAVDFMLLAGLFNTLSGAQELWAESAYVAVTFSGFALYWGIAFGYLSRMFERDADLFGAELLGDNVLFAQTLELIGHLNGVNPQAKSWRHGSIKSRAEFLIDAAIDAEMRDRFAAKVEFAKIFLVTAGIAAMLALGAIQNLV